MTVLETGLLTILGTVVGGLAIKIANGRVMKGLMSKDDHKEICDLTTGPIKGDIAEIKQDVKAIIKHYGIKSGG